MQHRPSNAAEKQRIEENGGEIHTEALATWRQYFAQQRVVQQLRTLISNYTNQNSSPLSQSKYILGHAAGMGDYQLRLEHDVMICEASMLVRH